MFTRTVICALGFFLSVAASEPAYGWVASRLGLSDVWILTCNDGTSYAFKGADGPDFYSAGKQCATHGGLVVAPPPVGTLTQFGVLTGVLVDPTSPVSVEHLVTELLITADDAFELTDSFDPVIWSAALTGYFGVDDPTLFSGVSVFGTAVELPNEVAEPGSFALVLLSLIALNLVGSAVRPSQQAQSAA